MYKLTSIKIKYQDDTYSDQIPISVLAENVEWDNTSNLIDIIGSVDLNINGSIQEQISKLSAEKVSNIDLSNYVENSISQDVTDWLNDHVNPIGSAVMVDQSLSVAGAAADAKKTGDVVEDLKDNLVPIDYAIAESVSWEVGAENKSQNWANGSITNNASCDVTKYTDISKYKYIKYPALYSTAKSTNAGIAFFSEKTVASFISGVKAYENAPQASTKEQVTEVPEGAVYARFTILATELSNFYINGFKSITNQIDNMQNIQDDIQTDLAQTEADVLATYAVDSASGAIASFPDGVNGVLVKSLKVDIEPVQAEGTPSPNNVLPITGWTQAKLYRANKNLAKRITVPSIVSGVTATPNADGTVTLTGTSTGGGPKIADRVFLKAGRYYVSAGYDAEIGMYPRLDGDDGTKYYPAAGKVIEITKSQNYFMREVVGTDNTVDLIVKPLICMVGDKSFVPSEMDEYTIDLDGTIYGGTLDVLSGVLHVDRVMFDASSKTWKSGGGGVYVYTTLSDTDTTQQTQVVCSHLSYSGGTGTVDGACSWGGDPNNGNLCVRSSVIASSLSDWQTYIQNNTVQFVYYLANPITVQLTVEDDITTLKGQNNIWSDTGDVDVEYRTDTSLYVKKITDSTNDYTIVNLFDSFVIGGISGAGAATTDNTRARTYKALEIPQGAYIECDPTIEYKVCYYTSNNAYRDTFEEVVPSAFTSDPIDLTVGRYAKLIVRYKASPSSAIEDASVLAGLVNVKIKMLTSEIKPLTNMYLSVMGDSMSAMAGYVPEGNDIYYSGSNHGVTSVDQMWWQVLCQKTGMIRCLINAWSGSGVTQLTDSSHLSKTPMSDVSRCSNLGLQAMTPDVIVIAGGTNDYSYAQQPSQEPLEWDGLQAPQDGTSFTQQYALMIHRIQEYYPDAIIVCCSTFFVMRGTDNGYTRTHTSGSNIYTQNDYDTAIKHVCSLMGVPFIEIRNIGFNQNNYYLKYAPDSAVNATHTNAAGQAVIGNAIAEKIVELVKGYVDHIVR